MRLNMDDRRSIVKKAISARFDPPREQIEKDKEAFALRLYESAYPKKVKEWAAQAPKGWLHLDTCLRFNVSGHSIKLNISEGVPVPYNAGYCQQLIAINNDELRDEHMALDKRETDLKAERQSAEAQLTALLGRVSTLNRLKEIWPEGEPFFSHLAPRDRVDVPAIQVSDINRLLGIWA